MSNLTVEELEKQAEEGKVIKEVFEVLTFRDPNHCDVIRKVCPLCGKVFDRYLVFAGGIIGCRKCGTKVFMTRLEEQAKKQLIGAIVSGEVTDKVKDLLNEGKEKLDELI